MVVLRSVLVVASLALLPSLASAESVRDRQEKACQADAMKFCRDDVPDETKIAACMGAHRSQLSVNCGIVFDNATR